MKKIILTQLLITMFLSIATLGSAQEHQHDKETIVLNDGQKWKVDDNMMVHIEQMANDVKATAENKEYDKLNKKLRAGINALTSDCTMKGKAHDELHKWLLPFIRTANEHKADMTEKQKNDWFTEVQESMTEFNKYFL